MAHDTNLEKFTSRRALPNKRAAITSLRLKLEELVQLKGPKKFRALIMPSRNLYDIRVAHKLGIPYKNLVPIENDPESYSFIKKHYPDCEYTDASRDLEKFVFTEDGSRKFNWMNLDMCGSFLRSTQRCIEHLSGKCFTDNSFLWLTIKCGREHKDDYYDARCAAIKRNFKLDFPTETLLQKRLFLSNFLMFTIPKMNGWKPIWSDEQFYRADIYTNGVHKNGGPMIVKGSVYERV